MVATDCYEQIAMNLGHLHKRMTRIQGEMLKAHNVSLMEYHILMMIMRSQKVSQNELAEALEVDKALISRQTQAMEQKGLINCCCNPDCRRQKVLTLTDHAEQLIPQLEEVHRQCLERIFEGVERKQIDEMNIFLKGLSSNL